MDRDKSIIKNCIQCGVCSSSCSFSKHMEYSPRKLINIFLLEDELPKNVNTLWLCTSCYTCSLRCPRGIPLVDFIYLIKENYHKKVKNKYSNFYSMFYKNIKKNKRLNEKSVFLRYLIKSPILLIKRIDLFLKLLLKRRL